MPYQKRTENFNEPIRKKRNVNNNIQYSTDSRTKRSNRKVSKSLLFTRSGKTIKKAEKASPIHIQHALINIRDHGHCARRKIRRGVLHAIGIAGKSGIRGRNNTYHRTIESEVKC